MFMKRFFIFILVSLFQMSAFSQIEDHWAGVCENIEFEYSFNETSDPLVYTLAVDINNIGSDTIFTYCDVFDTSTSGVTLTGNSGCYPELAPGATKTIDITVTLDTVTIDCFTVDFKIKNGVLNTNDYCSESIEFCTITPLGLESINRDNMEYTSIYFDMLGRESREPLSKGFYIERRTYEDGYVSLEKVYINL